MLAIKLFNQPKKYKEKMVNKQEKKLADSEKKIVDVISQNFTGQLKEALTKDKNAKWAIIECVFGSWKTWSYIACIVISFIIGFALCYFTLTGYDISIEKSMVNIIEKQGIVLEKK